MKLHSLLSAALATVLLYLPMAAMAQAAQVTPARASAPAPAKAAIVARSPTEWIQFDDLSVTPVIDDVSSHLATVRAALDRKDVSKAAEAMHAAARALEGQGERVAKLDRQRAAADLKAAKEVRVKMSTLTQQLDAAAAQIKAGKLSNTFTLDRIIGKAQRADLERRWLVSDLTTWYPVAEEPQRHFGAAIEAYMKKDYKAAATEVRKGAAYVRLEAARAAGDAKQGLDAANADLQKTAAALDKGALKAQKDMERTFASTNHALALAHRARAAESWARKSYDQVGYELKAAAHGLDSGATWAGAEAKAAASAAATDARAIGDKLASGGVWAKDEIAKGFESLGNGLNKLGQSIGSKSKASPFDVGA
jgi:soluble cytochrome b562